MLFGTVSPDILAEIMDNKQVVSAVVWTWRPAERTREEIWNIRNVFVIISGSIRHPRAMAAAAAAAAVRPGKLINFTYC